MTREELQRRTSIQQAFEYDPICPSCGKPWSGHEGATTLCRKVQELQAEIDQRQLRGCANERQGGCRGYKEVSDG